MIPRSKQNILTGDVFTQYISCLGSLIALIMSSNKMDIKHEGGQGKNARSCVVIPLPMSYIAER